MPGNGTRLRTAEPPETAESGNIPYGPHYRITAFRCRIPPRGQIAGQFLAESTTIGLLGGVIGSALGVVVVVSVSAVKDWTPVLDPRLALGAPVAGAVVGLLAGLYPSLRASRMEPVEALRS